MYIMTTQAGFKAESYRQEAISLAIKWSNVAYSMARKLNIGSQNASTADGDRLSASAILLARAILQNDSPATSLAQANYHLQICQNLVTVATRKIWLNSADKIQADKILDRLQFLIEQEKLAIGVD